VLLRAPGSVTRLLDDACDDDAGLAVALWGGDAVVPLLGVADGADIALGASCWHNNKKHAN